MITIMMIHIPKLVYEYTPIGWKNLGRRKKRWKDYYSWRRNYLVWLISNLLRRRCWWLLWWLRW